ncbi:hypothetical protein [Novacetimonas pomaceti]|uniref:Uncharacterized protein n=1 Tax=Novacetimonas pomaceti TaxID=2021998 RepID=A0ABX5P660_9PROT|nr:hypothetical protein [Novacetimonas pomaceti]PYD48387.1 hypothetical protein C3920_05000 [Novacetimonas pomaceti]
MNATAKFGGLRAVIALLLAEVPEEHALYGSAFILVCAAVAAMIPSPHAVSRWVVAYQARTDIGLNVGWAENHFKPGQLGMYVPLWDKPAAELVVAAVGILVPNRKSQPEDIVK